MSEDKFDPNADSPALQTPLAARSSPLGPNLNTLASRLHRHPQNCPTLTETIIAETRFALIPFPLLRLLTY